MKRRLKEPFGKAGLTVAIFALVLAMAGTALAASGALSGKQKKEVEKIAKKFAGKPGANGTNGAVGAKGDPGSAGSNGAPGAAGKSVVTSAAAVPGECPTGTTGTKFQVEGSATSSHVCSGANGTTGFTETLPPEKTETGVWNTGYQYQGGPPTEEEEEEGKELRIPTLVRGTFASFAIPLEEELEAADVHYINSEEPPMEVLKYTGTTPETTTPTECPGSSGEPLAEPGNLCIYASSEEGLKLSNKSILNTASGLGAGITGAEMQTFTLAEGEVPYGALGSWAVTAPAAP